MLKPLHWEKIHNIQNGSLWADLSPPHLADSNAQSLLLDNVELQDLFQASAPRLLSANGSGSKAPPSPGSKAVPRLSLDLRRASNCEIMLSSLKLSIPEIVEAVLTMDGDVLNETAAEGLQKFVPSKEEEELLRSDADDGSLQCPAEALFKAVIDVPRYGAKLRCVTFKLQFASQYNKLAQDIGTVISTCQGVRGSVPLRRIMKACLSLGNTLNAGTPRGSARGFRLSSLQRIIDTKSQTNQQLSLVDFLCKALKSKYPDLLDTLKQEAVPQLQGGSRMVLKVIGEEVTLLQAGLEQTVQELKHCKDDISSSAGGSVNCEKHTKFATALQV